MKTLAKPHEAKYFGMEDVPEEHTHWQRKRRAQIEKEIKRMELGYSPGGRYPGRHETWDEK